MKLRRNRYINEYVAGFFLGLLIIAAYYFSGKGLGSSGGLRDITVTMLNTVAPDYTANNSFTAPRVMGEHAPAHSWFVYLLFGIIFGAIISGTYFARLKLVIGKAPHMANRKRLYLALTGGVLWGVGTQLGGGCTSGLVLSGIAVNSLSGYLGLFTIFGFGYIFAFIFKRLWIKKN